MAAERVALAKRPLREALLERRANLSQEEASRMSVEIVRRAVETAEYRSARRIALYSSFNGEVATLGLFTACIADGKEAYYPRADKSRSLLAFVRVCDAKELVPGIFDIAEPCRSSCCEEIKVDALDLIVVPGVAFDRRGSRLGYGKGFYDRALKEARGPKAGLAYGFQVVEGDIETAPHDVGMDLIVTEKEVIKIEKGKGGH
jgi:5-formyltetrahydrofolate cyclo-ligase